MTMTTTLEKTSFETKHVFALDIHAIYFNIYDSLYLKNVKIDTKIKSASC